MPELPKVSQEFEADVSPYIAGIEEAIKFAKAFVEENAKVVASIEAIKAAMDSLHDKEVVVTVRYVTEGNLPEVKAATQVIKQVVVPANETITGGTQIINQTIGTEIVEGGAASADASAAALAREATVARDSATAQYLLAAAERMRAKSTTEAAVATAGAVGGLRIGIGWFRLTANAIHWIVMAAAEFLAVAIPAIVAFGAAAAVAAQGAQNVQIRVAALYTTAEALGPAVGQTAGQMLGLSNALQKAQDAMNPAIFEAFGGALNAVKGHMGALWVMGENVIRMFDVFIAKVDVELRGALGGQLTGLVAGGAQDLREFGQILGNLGHAIINFASAMPGVAEVILKLLDALSRLILIISQLPAPLITAAFAFEAFNRYGGLVLRLIAPLIEAVTGLKIFELVGGMIGKSGAEAAGATRGFAGLSRVLFALAVENPVGAIIAAIVLLTIGFGIWVDKAKSGTDQWIANVDQMVSRAPDFAVINTTVKALGENTRQLGLAQEFLSTKTSAWSRLASGAQQDVSALDRQHKQLTTDIFTETGNVGFLANKYGVGIPTAIALAQAAGVKLTTNIQGQSKEAQVARQQIDNLITGYSAMGQQGNQLVNSINAVTIANSNQVKNVNNLNTAWKTVIDMGANVQVGFLSFQQGLNTISDDAKKAGASFDGLNGQSLTLRQDFQKNISNMSASLQSMNTALSLGGVSWNQYRAYIATTVGEMLHAGNLSDAQKAQLGLIASAAGYTGQNYSALASWVGKYATSQSGANDIINTATINLSNLSQMTGQLQGTLQTDVIDTTAKMVLGQQGFQAELSKTYDAFKKGGTASAPFKADLGTLDKMLRNAGFSQQQVTQYNQFLETQFKDTSGLQTANGALKGHQGALDQTGVHASGLRDQIKNVFTAIFHEVEHYTDDATTYVVGKWHDVHGALVTAWGAVEGAAKTVWNTIYNDIYTPVRNAISDVKNAFTSGFDGWWKTHGSAIENIWNSVWQNVTGIWKTTTSFLSSNAGAFWNDLTAKAREFWAAIEPIVSAGWTVTKDIFKQAFADIKAAWQIFWDLLKAIGLTIFDGIRAGIKTVWDLIVGIFNVFIDVITGHWHQAWLDIKATGEQIWNAIKDFFGQAFDNFKAAFKSALSVIKSTWDTDWHDIKDIVTTVWGLISRSASAFWRDIKDGFRNAVDSIRNTWNELKADFHGPVAFLVNTVYEGGIRRFWNDIMGFVGGPKLPPEHFAGGGRVPGYGGGDVVPAMLEAGEAVVPKHLVGQLAPFLAMHNIPGFAQGGLVNPIGPGLRGERVDMGVDYGGSGNLYALGSGTITNLFNSGWPGGGFIGLQLNPPYGSGYWYYAEDVIPWGNIHKGSGVRAGQQIAMATGGNTGIEVGWAAPPGTGQTAAARDGQQNRGGDPGAFPTAWGVAANTLIKSLGGPGGIVRGPVHGGTPGFGGLTSVFGSIIKGVFHAISGTISGLGDAASVISALATGNGTALSNAMSKFIGPGGAKGALAQMMVGIPKTLIGDAVKFVEHFVAGHTTTQTTGGGALPHGPIGKNVGAELAFAQSHLAGYGWGQPQMGPLINLWNKESGWNPFAVNPSSGAYGIPQALGHGHPYALGDYMAQIIWGLNYIKSTYGSPAAAWGHEVAHNWYDQGGWLMPGVTMAVNNTGRPERILGPGEGQNGTIEATFHVHTHMNGREIWRDVQKETFRYDMRNRGQVTGGLSNLDK